LLDEANEHHQSFDLGEVLASSFFKPCNKVSSVIRFSNHYISNKHEKSVMEFVEKGSEINLRDLPDKP
jgi:hypothetical protein